MFSLYWIIIQLFIWGTINFLSQKISSICLQLCNWDNIFLWCLRKLTWWVCFFFMFLIKLVSNITEKKSVGYTSNLYGNTREWTLASWVSDLQIIFWGSEWALKENSWNKECFGSQSPPVPLLNACFVISASRLIATKKDHHLHQLLIHAREDKRLNLQYFHWFTQILVGV